MNEREIAMAFFTFYFNTGLIASIEQVVERIRNILCPFDQELQKMCGIDPSRVLEIAFWCSMFLQAGIDNMREISAREKEVRISLVEKWEKENWDIDTLKEKAREGPWNDRAKELIDALSGIGTIPLKELLRVFGKEKATTFWDTFVSCRGKVGKFTYMTEKNPAESKPLFLTEDSIVYCPSINALFISILNCFSNVLLKSEHRQSFLKKRDRFLENKTAAAFRHFLGNSSSIYQNVYETQTSQLEHDLIIISQEQILIVENKASPAVEPFRNPDKAFKRIRHAFKKDQGIQEAYNQANRLRKRLLAGEKVTLFDSKGEPVVMLDPANIQKVFCACVTADNFGPLATELSLLLEKEVEEEYPWVTNIFDLETFLDGLSYRKWGPQKLFEFLASRIGLHGKVIAGDELEIAGIFLSYDTLDSINKKTGGKIILSPGESLIFDQIYVEKHGGPKPNFSKRGKLVFTDFRKELKQRIAPKETIDPVIKSRQQKVGRNEPCPCGSGLKYKKCCGQ